MVNHYQRKLYEQLVFDPNNHQFIALFKAWGYLCTKKLDSAGKWACLFIFAQNQFPEVYYECLEPMYPMLLPSNIISWPRIINTRKFWCWFSYLTVASFQLVKTSLSDRISSKVEWTDLMVAWNAPRKRLKNWHSVYCVITNSFDAYEQIFLN